MSVYTTNEIADKVRPIAEAYGIDKVYLFGSYARGEATENSDIDYYVEFSKPLGLRYCSFFSDIEESVGKNVDIISENPLCSLSVLYFENAEYGAMGQAPFGSFFLPEKSSAELTASETFALDSSNI